MTRKFALDISAVVKEDQALGDNELILLVREKNAERYAEIIERYQGKLFAYLYRLIGNRDEAEDLLQDVFIKAYKNLYSYDVSRKFSSWIYRIAHNEAVNYIKRKSLKRFISWEDISSTKDKLVSQSTEDGADDAWIRKESIKEVDDAIKRLPIKYKQVLLLRYFSDKSYEEIGEILGKPVNTVGTLINRAKKNLAEVMEKLKR
ncbi:MAG: sigma-70 family RNA polymerase sigma factor [Parcubacteria group bacterium]|jgi:RNA polymerase sigma-70 factor (ECF subfamily)